MLRKVSLEIQNVSIDVQRQFDLRGSAVLSCDGWVTFCHYGLRVGGESQSLKQACSSSEVLVIRIFSHTTCYVLSVCKQLLQIAHQAFSLAVKWYFINRTITAGNTDRFYPST